MNHLRAAAQATVQKKRKSVTPQTISDSLRSLFLASLLSACALSIPLSAFGQEEKDPHEGLNASNSADKKQIAQYGPGGRSQSARTQHLPAVTGTVQIRKPFKLVAQANQGIIHHLSFRDTPVRELIAEIARRGNLNIIVDKSVDGRITGELKDVTLNEAMDTILASAGLESRRLENNVIIVASSVAMVQLKLNRQVVRAFKLSYAHPFDVAQILQFSVFNKGVVSSFDEKVGLGDSATEPGTKSQLDQTLKKDEVAKQLNGTTREQIQEGTGFNNAAVEPGSQQVRQVQEINALYSVPPNDGGAIVIPDAKGRQVIVVGTREDVDLAGEAIALVDRRPRQVHIQSSLIEITNQGIRQLGATINLQGDGMSGSIMGNPAAPLLSFLPGLGSPANAVPNPQIPAIPFTGTNVTGAANPFAGLVGAVLPNVGNINIAGITPVQSSASGFNFLTLSQRAGGRANIATVPYGLNVNVQMLLQTNKAKVIANPSLVVVDNTEALITIANEVVHKVTSTVSLGVVTTNVEIAKAGIFLNILPRLTEDGFVRLRLRPQVSAPLGAPQTFGVGANQTTVTLLSIRDVISQEVRIKDGQTLVIGGLFTEQEASQLSKVPYFAEAPLLGAFFRTTLKGRNRTELMLMITPKIVEEENPRLTQSESPTL
ncbi:MAG: hypothetical protein KIT34_11990 [Cyanobacteria bacterium TGS_CYA1]|nr:hypothetical protein [Cyanobacteria bacterium TGS_CYA1]